MQADAPTVPKEAILLLGNNHTSLSVARSLGRTGHSVIVGRSTPTSAERSACVSDVWQHPPIEADPSGFIDALCAYLAQRPDITALLPVSGHCLLQLLPFRDRVPVPFAAVATGIVEACTDDSAVDAIVARLDLPHARAVTASSLEELRKAASRVGFPCVARPKDGPVSGGRPYIFDDAQSVATRFRQWPPGLGALLLQPFFPGRRYHRYFVAENGALLQCADIRVLRTNQPNGAGKPVEAVSVPPIDLIDRATRDLLAELNYTGVGCLSFLIDDTETRYRFLALNPGLGGCSALVARLGLDQVGALLALARGETLAQWHGAFTYRAGLRYAWSFGDFMGLLRAVHTRTVSRRGMVRWLWRVPVTFCRAHARATFSLRDPRPCVYLSWVALRMLARFVVVESADFGLRGVRFVRARI